MCCLHVSIILWIYAYCYWWFMFQNIDDFYDFLALKTGKHFVPQTISLNGHIGNFHHDNLINARQCTDIYEFWVEQWSPINIHHYWTWQEPLLLPDTSKNLYRHYDQRHGSGIIINYHWSTVDSLWWQWAASYPYRDNCLPGCLPYTCNHWACRSGPRPMIG